MTTKTKKNMPSGRRMIAILTAVSVLGISCLTGCAGKDKEETDTEETQDTSAQTVTDSVSDSGSDTAASSKPSAKDALTDDHDSEASEGELTFAKKLCGKYSSRSDGEEYDTLEIFEFAGNIYAFGAEAMADEDVIEPYSFWATEVFPQTAKAVKDADADSIEAGIMSFSIMSNLSKYQSAPQIITIGLTDSGIYWGGQLYKKDDRVSDAFPYMGIVPGSYMNSDTDESLTDEGTETLTDDDSDATSGSTSTISYKESSDKDEKLVGLWRQKKAEVPCYLEFKDGNLRIYKKSADEEVIFGCGGYDADGDKFKCTYSLLVSGGMPYDLNSEYYIDSDGELTIAPDVDDVSMFDPEYEYIFEPVKESDVPIITLSDVYAAGYDDSYKYDLIDFYSDAYSDSGSGVDFTSFYGVWISAFPNTADADALVSEVKGKGFEASSVLSTDWSNLSTEPYYCVTAGKCATESIAKDLLEKVKAAGYTEAYIKESGDRINVRVYYILYDLSDVEVSSVGVKLKDVDVIDQSGDNDLMMDLVIDDSSFFDPYCDMSPFENYVQGDTVYEWFMRNYDKISDAEDDYDSQMTLRGVFDASLTGRHVDRVYGSYWWD